MEDTSNMPLLQDKWIPFYTLFLPFHLPEEPNVCVCQGGWWLSSNNALKICCWAPPDRVERTTCARAVEKKAKDPYELAMITTSNEVSRGDAKARRARGAPPSSQGRQCLEGGRLSRVYVVPGDELWMSRKLMFHDNMMNGKSLPHTLIQQPPLLPPYLSI